MVVQPFCVPVQLYAVPMRLRARVDSETYGKDVDIVIRFKF